MAASRARDEQVGGQCGTKTVSAQAREESLLRAVAAAAGRSRAGSQAEGQHRDHAIVEQVFADVTSGPLAHMPSGVFAANAAWLSVAAMAHNLLRAAGALASLPFAKARATTIRRDLIAVAARTARHGRGHITVHLPEAWHREQEWLNLLAAACGPPAAAA